MNLYFYGGTFDPPHIGHKIVVDYFLNNGDQFLIIPTYQSPFKTYKPISYSHREKMLKIMFSDLLEKIKIIDFEYKNKSKYTFNTIKFLKEKYPNYNINMILGVDQFNEIDSWKSSDYVLNSINLFVISRPGYKVKEKKNNVKFIDDISVNISSKKIRDNISSLDKIEPMLDRGVLEYIIENKIYR